MIKTYSELIQLETFKERFEYLKLDGVVGQDTFGRNRYLNQLLYTSPRWRKLRNEIIIRDNACDLGVFDYDIYHKIYIHHIVPIGLDDVRRDRSCIYNPENLICTSGTTHNAIHYGGEIPKTQEMAQRKPGDTIPW